MKKLTFRRNYAEARRTEYPEIGEQLDAIWKALESSGLNLPPETSAMLARVNGVKAKFPKPERRDADR